jgi:hypothetical protein
MNSNKEKPEPSSSQTKTQHNSSVDAENKYIRDFVDNNRFNDFVEIEKEVQKTTSLFFGSSAGGHFLSLWLINFMIYIVTLGAIFQFIPSELEWLTKAAFYTCIFVSFAASAYSIYKHKREGKYFETPIAIADSLKITVIGTAIIIILYASSFFFSPPHYVTESEVNDKISALRSEFLTVGLNDIQITQMLKVLRDGRYVTEDELPDGLTEQQKAQVMQIINSSLAPFSATLTAIPSSSCYLTLKDTAESVYIRDNAAKSSKVVDYLEINDVALVMGHDGGYPNNGWWYIEVTHHGETNKGWIISNWVELKNEKDCSQIIQIATPFP